jgi:hypothetical protein
LRLSPFTGIEEKHPASEKHRYMRIIVDADACPRVALQICSKAGAEFNIPVWTVASFNHSGKSSLHIIVGDDAQETDIKVANLTRAGDIVVTQDWGLAAIVLGKGASCLGPTGVEYRAETIGFLLEERELKARLRRGGGRTKGPRKRTQEDDDRFDACLRKILARTGVVRETEE